MKKLLNLLAAVLAAFRGEQPQPDPFTSFDTRDWADLPIYHPIADPDPRARC